jgi:hypothetical protein
MRKVYFFIFLNFSTANLYAATIFWDNEAGDGLWNTPTNWVGNVVPAPTDDVVLDNSIFGVSYTVTLPGGAISTSINSLTITPFGINNIALDLPITNTSNPGFVVTGPGDAIILNSGAILRNSSGASAGSGISITNNFRINNGGHYIHNTNRAHATIVNQLSAVVGTELGEFEYDIPSASTPLSLSNRIYGSLTLTALANGGTTTYIGSGANPLNIKGNLKINTGVTFSVSFSANIIVSGNYNQFAASIFNLQSSTNNNIVQISGNITSQGTITESNTGQPSFELNGTTNQNIDFTGGSILNTVDFNLNNPGGATLLSTLTLPYRYTITSGNLTLGNNNFTTPAINQVNAATPVSNHIVTNGTGLLKILSVGAVPVSFPIGPSSSTLNPVTISHGNAPADFSARVETGIVPALALPIYGIHAINRTWNIQASTVTPGVTVTFQYAGADANAGVMPNEPMEILQNISSVWTIMAGNINILPIGLNPYTVTTTNPITITSANSTPYLIGKTGGFVLPLDYFITSSAQKINNSAIINWKVSDIDNVNNFEVQRSTKNGGFQTIAMVNPVTQQMDYTVTDADLPKGTNLYRIKVNRQGSGIRYSNTVAVINDTKGLLITSIHPNPFHSQATITISAAKSEKVIFQVYDMAGRRVKQWHSTVIEGNNAIPLSLSELNAGIYQLAAFTTDTKAAFTIIKQ